MMRAGKYCMYLVMAILMVFSSSHAASALEVRDLGIPLSWVSDYTGTLSAGDCRQLEKISTRLEVFTSVEMAYVVLDTLDGEDIESFAIDLFNEWGIGKAEDDTGILILIVTGERMWRVEIGYGLEPVFTRELLIDIMESHAVPHFRNGDYGAGIVEASLGLTEILYNEYGDD
jgi:uncharacterized protein